MNSLSDEYVSSLATADTSTIPHSSRTQIMEEAGSLPAPKQKSPLLMSLVEALQVSPVVLCAEPGMGKSSLMAQAAVCLGSQDVQPRYEDFEGRSTGEVSQRLSEVARWCRKRISQGAKVLVVCDNVPVGDEADVYGLLRLIRRIVSYGTLVIMALLPEGETLCEQFGEASVYWSCDLRAIVGPLDGRDALGSLTHGIPQLVAALPAEAEGDEGVVLSDPHYQHAYARVVEGCLRPGLLNEDLRMRCVMLLLGKGAVDDVRAVVGTVEATTWRLLQRDAPFFGVNVIDGTFTCVVGEAHESLGVVFSLLSARLSEWPDLVVPVAELLVRRGEFSRAATVCLASGDAHTWRALVVERAAEFVNAGQADVVTEALADYTATEHDGLRGIAEARCILRALDGGANVLYEAPRAQEAVPALAIRHATLVAGCRQLLRSVKAPLDLAPRQEDDQICEALLSHLQATKHIVDGRLTEAYLLLLETPQRLEEQSVVSALLQMDYVLCSLLVGIAPSPTEMDLFERAGGFLERHGMRSLVRLHGSVLVMASMLMGRCMVDHSLEFHIQRATRVGEVLLRGVYLLVSSVGDMRATVPARAFVRLEQAADALCAAGAKRLEKIARLLIVVIRIQLGERVTRTTVHAGNGISKDYDHVVRLISAAAFASRHAKVEGMGRWATVSCPKDVLWLVNVLAHDCGSFSRKFQEVLPLPWRDSMRRATSEVDAFIESQALQGVHAKPNGPLPPPLEPSDKQTGHPGSAVEVLLLGGFEVRVNGLPLPGKQLERRRAKSLLALLAAVPGHVAKRFTIMESIWPEYDYASATRCVYAATSALRAEVGPVMEEGQMPTVVISNKAEGTVGLDIAHVRCDVDAFESRAHKVLDSEGDDRFVISVCRDIEELYKGDLFVPPNDGAGIVERRSRELRELYADTMVAGAHAAANLGMRMLACRFARKGHAADDMREDAIRALVMALCAAGRQIEAQRCYESYASRVINLTRRPPSKQLRNMVQELVREAEVNSAPKATRSSVRIVDAHVAKGQGGGQLAFDLGGA